MKTKINLMITFLFIGINSLIAQDFKTEKFKVYGNCGMCESRIEKAAKSIEGVSAADWDKETKMIEVTFNDTKTDSEKIQQAIADVGHDTESVKAKDETYEALPSCCKYDRPKEK